MPRLHTLYLPGNGEGMPFAFILDQATPMHEAAIAAWQGFAEKCGALDIMLTADTIDIDPEISDGWQPDDDEPVDYYAADQHDPNCDGQHIPLPDLLSMVQAAHAAAWVPWEPANLDPESPKISTHREEVCPALNNGAEGCPMHAPIDNGPWAFWPYYASNNAEIGTTITRICDHGITHPTPEEYLGGLDIPHLCDGCECAPEEDRDRYAIVVSDLANTRLPRGTLLLGVKDDPTPVTAPPASDWVAKQDAYVGCGDRFQMAAGSLGCNLPGGHDGAHQGGGKVWYSAPATPEPIAADLATENWGTATIQPLGPDGEPVGEAKDYPLAGPVTITKKTYGDPEAEMLPQCAKDTGGGQCLKPSGHGSECAAYNSFTDTVPVEDLPYTFAEPTAAYVGCGAGGDRGDCTLRDGHEGLHDFGPFTRV